MEIESAESKVGYRPIIKELADAILLNTKVKVLVMLSAYFDASYTEPGRNLVVIGGCVARVPQWVAFESEWEDMLARAGLQFFHMTDFEARQGPYKHWPNDKRDEVIRKFTSIISQHVELAVSRAVMPAELEVARLQNKNLAIYSGFTLCALQCLHGVASWADKESIEGPIAYFFEAGDGYDEFFGELRFEIEQSEYLMQRFRWNGLTIAPKLGEGRAVPLYPITPLQAADIWAFEVRKEMESNIIPETPLRPFRRSATALLEGEGRVNCGYYEQAELLPMNAFE